MVYGEEKHWFGNVTRCVAGKKIKGRGKKNQKRLNNIHPCNKVRRVDRRTNVLPTDTASSRVACLRLKSQGCILLSRFWFRPPHIVKNNVIKVWKVLNCVLLIVFYDLVLSIVIFSPNFLFFSFFPLRFPSPSPDPRLKTQEYTGLPLCLIVWLISWLGFNVNNHFD